MIRRIQYQPHQRAALDAGDDVPAPTSARRALARAWLVELLGCRWCLGVWITGATVLADAYWGRSRWFIRCGDAAVAAYALGWLAGHEGD